MVTILYIKTTKFSNEHYNMFLIVFHKREIFFNENVFTTHCTYFMLAVEIINKKLSNKNKGRIC